jgi:ElaB/YqjD/DUF883 family membrane-anchored ribosome-binding protein
MPNSSTSHAKNRVQAAAEAEGSAVLDGLQNATDAVRQAAADSIDAVRETASEFIEQGRAKAEEVGESVGTNVREQPVKSVLIAAVIGFLLGMLFLRR